MNLPETLYVRKPTPLEYQDMCSIRVCSRNLKETVQLTLHHNYDDDSRVTCLRREGMDLMIVLRIDAFGYTTILDKEGNDTRLGKFHLAYENNQPYWFFRFTDNQEFQSRDRSESLPDYEKLERIEMELTELLVKEMKIEELPS